MTKEDAIKFVEFVVGNSTVRLMAIRDCGHGEFHATQLLENGNWRMTRGIGFDTVDDFLCGVKWGERGTPLPKGLTPPEQVKWIKEVYPTLPKQ